MNRVKEAREELGISQEELASKTGISRYYISRIEREDNVNVTKLIMLKIAEALGKRASDLFLL